MSDGGVVRAVCRCLVSRENYAFVIMLLKVTVECEDEFTRVAPINAAASASREVVKFWARSCGDLFAPRVYEGCT